MFRLFSFHCFFFQVASVLRIPFGSHYVCLLVPGAYTEQTEAPPVIFIFSTRFAPTRLPFDTQRAQKSEKLSNSAKYAR